MSRVVSYLQRTFRHIIVYLQLLHIVLSRQIKTALGNLQRVDEKNIVELGDSGEHSSIQYADTVVDGLYVFCDILRFSLSNLPNAIQCYSIRGRISTCHGFSCPSYRRIRHCKACSIVAMWSSILSERVSPMVRCLTKLKFT
jgi:hypothetical protein